MSNSPELYIIGGIIIFLILLSVCFKKTKIFEGTVPRVLICMIFGLFAAGIGTVLIIDLSEAKYFPTLIGIPYTVFRLIVIGIAAILPLVTTISTIRDGFELTVGKVVFRPWASIVLDLLLLLLMKIVLWGIQNPGWGGALLFGLVGVLIGLAFTGAYSDAGEIIGIVFIKKK